MASVFSPGSAMPAMQKSGVTFLGSSFGLDNTTMGPGFNAHGVVNSQRMRELEFRESFYTCTIHDTKMYDFNGRMMRPGPVSVTQQFIGSAMPSTYVPLDQRRPSSPYRLPRVIVNSFTSMVFGHGRFPTIKVVGDPKTQDFSEALIKAQRLSTVMIQARNIGGSVGTVGLAWRFDESGRPRTTVHNGKYLHVHSWDDREAFIPEHVSEIFQYPKDEWEPTKKQYVRNLYWHRRDWTPVSDVAFEDIKVTAENPIWKIDPENSVRHDDGFCHFVWIRNLPDDCDSIDGLPDYAELYENFNTIDILNSVVARGGVLNLDPTLVLKMDPDIVQRHGVRKGSDNSLLVGLAGGANYLELSGTSVSAGNELCAKERKQALEVAQCVSPDPDTIAAAGTSSLAMKMIYAPMLGRCDILRDQYGELGVVRLLEQQINSARRRMLDDDGNPVYEVETGEDGVDRKIKYVVSLPPRVITEDAYDDAGSPTGETFTRYEDRTPGQGGDIECNYPPYFKETADDRQKNIATLTAAAGGKAVLGLKTAVELAAASYDRDPIEEWTAVAKGIQADKQSQQEMFPPIGGQVDHIDELPPGADELSPMGPGASTSTVDDVPPAVLKSVFDLVKSVAAGEFPRDSAIGILTTLYKLDQTAAQAVLGTAGTQLPTQPNPGNPAVEAAKAKAQMTADGNPPFGKAPTGPHGNIPGEPPMPVAPPVEAILEPGDTTLMVPKDVRDE